MSVTLPESDFLSADRAAIVWSYPGMRVEDGIVHIHHVNVEVGCYWPEQCHAGGNGKGGAPGHLFLFLDQVLKK